jgi:hypothetical protein
MTAKDPVPIKPDFNPGGARWCEEHGRAECTKRRRRGQGVCHKDAIRGTDACTHHAGRSFEVASALGEARIDAWNAIGQGAKTIDPATAVLGVLQMTWLRLAAYGQLLKRQVERDRAIEAEQSPDDPEMFGFGEEVKVAKGTEGLIGYSIGAAGKDGTLYRQSEQVRALVMLEGTERDRVIKYAKTAHDMGISTRMTELAEQWGDLVAVRVTQMFDDLQLTPEQQALVPAVVQRHLGSLDMSAGQDD